MTATQLDRVAGAAGTAAKSVAELLGNATIVTLEAESRALPLRSQTDAWILETIASLEKERAELNPADDVARTEIDADLGHLTIEANARHLVFGDEEQGSDVVDVPPAVQEAFDSAAEAMSNAFAADEAGDNQESFTTVAYDSPAPAIGDMLSKHATSTLKPKARKRPMSALPNEWIVNTLARLNAELLGALGKDRTLIANDIAVLTMHAGVRDLPLEPVDGHVDTGVFAEPADDANPPIAERETSDDGLSDAHVDAVIDHAASDVAREIREANTPIGVATELPGSPPVMDLVVELSIDDISPDPDQPRLEVDTDLSDSIAAEGVKQPIVVRRHPHAGEPKTIGLNHGFHPPYMIVDGERRWKAAHSAGLEKIRARVTTDAEDAGDRLLLQVVLNEGKRLAPMEEAKAWKRIMDAKGWNIKQLATALGRAKSTVSDRLAMLDVPNAFAEFFMDGTLSAAAAPVLRKFTGIGEDISRRLIASAEGDREWRAAVDAGKPVALDVVERAFTEAAENELQFLRADDPAAQRYTGPVVTLGKDRYAIDVVAYDAVDAQIHDERAKAAGSSPTHRADAQKSLNAENKAAKERERVQREQALAKRDAEQRLRVAQFAAVSAKLPSEIDGRFALLLLDTMKENLWGFGEAGLRAVGIPVPVKSVGGHNFTKLIRQHAEKLDAKGRIRLLLQIVIWSDEKPYLKDEDYLAAAAQLLKLDLGKVRAPDPADVETKKSVTAAPAKKKLVAKKSAISKPSTKKRTPSAVFMKPLQPSPALAAIVGAKPIPRTEITKKLWDYIKKNGLQDKKERRIINADAKLKPVFGGKSKASMFEMTKLVNKHLSPAKAAGAKK